MSDYPKVMHRGLDEATVPDAAGQADLERGGWVAGDGSRVLPLPTEAAEPVEADPPTFGAADDGTGGEPTEGPADDQTHVKRARKKK